MSVESMPAGFGPGSGWAALREIAGADEAASAGTDALAATRLLDRLLLADPAATIGPGGAAALPVSARDRLLAAVFGRAYGDRIESSLTCRACGGRFDLDFSLADLVASLADEAARAPVERRADGTFRLEDGRVFRLPTGEDEQAVRGLPPEVAAAALLSRCVVGEDAADSDAITAAMAAVGPTLSRDIEATCPECGAAQAVRFDIQSYLLTALEQDQPRLAFEVHRLATAYGWGRAEILAIPRAQRRAYVALIEAEAAPRRRFA